MVGKIMWKMFCSLPLRLISRKCGLSNSGVAVMWFFITILIFYMCISYYSVINEKSIPILDAYNETGFTETPIIVNTETTNVMLRKQQVNNEYKRPLLANETVSTLQSVQIGQIVLNCGMKQSCGRDEFAVHLYTGKDHRDEPKVCIDSKYILTKTVNGGGRGLNVAVVDNFTRTVIRVGHFDTYEKDSTALETLLLTLRPGDIVILITFDEPSRKLTRIARLLLYDLGSGLVQNLSYRSSWYMITQKGLSGFSPYEELNLVENNGWPLHHDVRFCVPFEIKGKSVHPDPFTTSNPARVQFCKSNEDLPYFCDADVVNDPLVPSPVWKQSTHINKIYDVPMIVMSGENDQLLPLTLETIVRQPGVKPSSVVVFYLENNKMIQNLTELFGFLAEQQNPSLRYCDRVEEAFETISLLYPDAKENLFIAENAILAPDFLYFMGQLLSVFKMDKSILSVSALNENGFVSISGDPSLVYRAESFSGVAVLVRKGFFKKSWCSLESLIDPFLISSGIEGFHLVPDVSRVTLAAPFSNDEFSQNVSFAYLSHVRTITYEQNIMLRDTEQLVQEEYDKELEEKLSHSMAALEFDMDSLKLCLTDKESFQRKILDDLPLFISNATNWSSKVLAIFIHQEHSRDLSTFQHLCQCLGLFHHPLYPVRGIYKGILRFMLKENQAVLIGSKSPFFKFKPKLIPSVKFDASLKSLVNVAL